MEYETVKFDVQDNGVATMTLNRPEKLNAFTRVMFKEWEAIVERCAYDDDIKVLVVAAEGRAFSSGVDLSLLGNEKPSPQFRFYYRQAHQQGFDSLEAGKAGDRGDQRSVLRRRSRAGALLRHPVRRRRRHLLPDRE